MKINKLIATSILGVCTSLGSFAQGVLNQGAFIGISSGTHIVVTNSGGYTNTSGGTMDIDGVLKLDGNFTNNAANNAFINADADGEVIFAKTGTQAISGSGDFVNFEKVTINAGSTTNLVAGFAATANGDLTIDGKFVLQSPANENPTGSLITEASVINGGSGVKTMEIERFFKVASRWQYVGTPITNVTGESNATDDIFDNTNLPNLYNANLLSYNEAYDAGTDPGSTNYDAWNNTAWGMYNAWVWVAEEGSSVDLVPTVGYATYNETNVDAVFSTTNPASELNTDASYSSSVTYNANDANSNYFDGWNFVSNPYQSAIDWDEAGWTKTNIDNTVYLFDGDNVDGSHTGNYVYYNSGTDHLDFGDFSVNKEADSRYIPAMQGFMVKANADNPVLTIPASARIHKTTTAMLRDAETRTLPTYEYIKLKTGHNGLTDETAVRFLETATALHDSDFDAYKMYASNTEIPMLYSLTSNEEQVPLAINSLPLSEVGTTVPLGFKTQSAGTFTISVSQMNFFASTDVILVDTQEGTQTDLRLNDEYTFDYEGGENRERFYLFAGLVSDIPDNINKEVSAKIWSKGKGVYVSINSNQLIEANAEITNLLGQKVLSKKINSAYTVLDTRLASGTYIVTVYGKNGVGTTEKVYIEN